MEIVFSFVRKTPPATTDYQTPLALSKARCVSISKIELVRLEEQTLSLARMTFSAAGLFLGSKIVPMREIGYGF